MKTTDKTYHLLIGVPAYNEEANIGYLLENLIGQNQKNLVVDAILVYSDGSTDRTNEIVSLYQDRGVELKNDGKRKGQNFRQNQMICEFLKSGADSLAILEADTLPTDSNYLENLVSKIPKNGVYSLISADSTPVKDVNLLGRVLNFGFFLRHEIFEKAVQWPNLYLRTNGLFSRQFLSSFRWSKRFHEDSYCYRMAIKSGLPIIRCDTAVVLFRSVENLRDYFLQSSKFRKAAEEESDYSDIYKISLDYLTTAKIAIKYIINNFVFFIAYLMLIGAAGVYSAFAKKYSPFWSIYSSSKGLIKND